MSEMTAEQTIEQLHGLIKLFEEESFQGVLIYVNSIERVGWVSAVRGSAQDRLALVDAAMLSMKDEPNQETKNWFFTQLYERLKLIIPKQQIETGLV